jgi:hypothetical protein
MKKWEIEFKPTEDLLNACIDIAIERDMLCAKCLKLYRTADALNQSDFCQDCINTINQIMETEVLRRMREGLKTRGIDPKAVQRGDEQ